MSTLAWPEGTRPWAMAVGPLQHLRHCHSLPCEPAPTPRRCGLASVPCCRCLPASQCLPSEVQCKNYMKLRKEQSKALLRSSDLKNKQTNKKQKQKTGLYNSVGILNLFLMHMLILMTLHSKPEIETTLFN